MTMIQPTYTWKIDAMTGLDLDSDRPNYVTEVAWTLVGRYEKHLASVGHRLQLDRVPSDNFIAYESLTEDIVAGWVKRRLGASNILVFKATIQRILNDRVQPPTPAIKDLGLPWSSYSVSSVNSQWSQWKQF